MLENGTFMEKVVRANRCPLRQHTWCYTHNGFCPLFGSGVAADIEVAGLPCIDFSKAGKRLGPEGPHSKVFVAHAKRHVEMATPVIVIENVWDRGSKRDMRGFICFLWKP